MMDALPVKELYSSLDDLYDALGLLQPWDFVEGRFRDLQITLMEMDLLDADNLRRDIFGHSRRTGKSTNHLVRILWELPEKHFIFVTHNARSALFFRDMLIEMINLLDWMKPCQQHLL